MEVRHRPVLSNTTDTLKKQDSGWAIPPPPFPQNDFTLNFWVLKKRGQPRNGLFYPSYTKRGVANDVSYCAATVGALNGGSKLFCSSMFSHDVTVAMVFQTNL